MRATHDARAFHTTRVRGTGWRCCGSELIWWCSASNPPSCQVIWSLWHSAACEHCVIPEIDCTRNHTISWNPSLDESKAKG